MFSLDIFFLLFAYSITLTNNLSLSQNWNIFWSENKNPSNFLSISIVLFFAIILHVGMAFIFRFCFILLFKIAGAFFMCLTPTRFIFLCYALN